MKKQKLNQNGITLIALVITIIVLLILAGITINLTIGEKGIITRAQEAGKNYLNAQEREEALLEEFTNEMDNIIKDLTNGGEDNTPETPIISINELRAGDYIEYNSGTNGKIICRVLYEASSQYGLQIISDKNVKTIKLGGNDWTEGRTSYNSVITTLNNEAMAYKNDLYAIDARCVGSDPSDKNKEEVGPAQLQFVTTVEGANNMKEKDTHYLIDWDAMKAATSQGSGIHDTGEAYWLASRYVHSLESSCGFSARYGTPTGTYSRYLCNVDSDNINSGTVQELGLRPCISMRTNIKVISGDGKSEKTAYKLSI